MRVVRHLSEGRPPFRSPVVALGNFDGCHRGHREIVCRAIESARKRGGEAVVFTFAPHPVAVLHPERAPPMILSVAERLRQLAALGVDGVFLQRFTRSFASIEPEDFVGRVLVEALGAESVVVGYDANFGRDRRGTPELLVELGRSLGLAVDVVPPVRDGDQIVSSSAIRHAIQAGDMRLAAALLGRPHGVRGRVFRGDRRGASIGFPTANLLPRGGLLPPDGVYAVSVGLAGEAEERAGVANLGCNPTFGGLRRRLEVHLFDFEGDLYGRTLRVAFRERLRGEIRFATVDALVEQIRADARRARHALARPLP